MKRKARWVVIALAVLAAFTALCVPAQALQIYTVTNLNASGTGSFKDCLTQSESDGEESRIIFDVGGTIYPGQRYNVYSGGLTVCGTDADSPGITFDFGHGSMGFYLNSSNNRLCNVTIANTGTNTDGITVNGKNNVVERCTFSYCRDEAVGITHPSTRGNVVAYCRIEHCGSQSDPFEDGRGILITDHASAVVVGNYIATSRSGVMCNYYDGFMDFRNNLVEDNLSNYGAGLGGSDGNLIDNVVRDNTGYGMKLMEGQNNTCEFYRSGNTVTGNSSSNWYIENGCTEVYDIITITDTPFPSWLEDADTPSQASDVGMGTGQCQCEPGGNYAPTADAGSNQTVKVNTVATFDGSGSYDPNQDPLTYTWAFGDGGTGTGETVTHTYTVTGVYTVTLTVDDGELNDDDTCICTVQPNYAPVADTGGDRRVYVEYIVEFDGSGSYDANNDPLTYTWNLGNEDTGTGVTLTTSYTTTGTYTVTLTVDDGELNDTDTCSVEAVEGGVEGDYYVDGAYGDDNNAGTSTQPWATIQKAADTLTAGETVVVRPGTYAEKVVTANGGTVENPITYRADTSLGGVIISSGKDNCFVNAEPHVVLDGFEITGATGAGVLFKDNEGDYCIIKRLIVRGNGGDGIKVGYADDVTVENCISYDNNSEGIVLTSSADGAEVYNCSVYGNGSDGIKCNASDTTIEDCIITGNGGWGINTLYSVIVTTDYNDVWNNTSGSYDDTSKITIGANSISSDPELVDPDNGDFHLDSNSPCKNTASDGKDMGYRYPTGGCNYSPVADAGTDRTVKVNTVTTLDGSGSSDLDEDALTYTWNFGDGATATGETVTHSYSATGVYTVTLTVFDGEYSDDDFCVCTIEPNHTPVAEAGSDIMIYKNVSITLDGSGSSDANGDPLTYSWNFGDGNTADGVTVTHAYTATGAYTVTLTVNDGEASDGDICEVEVVQGLDADYYVDAERGDDNNAGSVDAPWATVQKAADTLTAGESVAVRAGTYAEKVIADAGGTAGNPISYLADTVLGDVVIDSGKDNAFVNQYPYVVLDGFKITGSSGTAVLFKNNDGDYCILRNLIVYESGGEGIKVNYADDADIENCLTYDNSGKGILIASNADGAEVYNCTVYGNGNDGVKCNASDTTMEDCIITDNDGWGVATYGTVAVTTDYNDVWNNTSGSYDNTSKISVGANSISTYPDFIDPENDDYHLDPDSPCVGAASDGGDLGYRYE